MTEPGRTRAEWIAFYESAAFPRQEAEYAASMELGETEGDAPLEDGS